MADFVPSEEKGAEIASAVAKTGKPSPTEKDPHEEPATTAASSTDILDVHSLKVE